jgi:hypothetical protein
MKQAESSVPPWRKSSRCDSGQCVEVAWRTGGVAVRNNTIPDLQLSFDRASWHGLLRDLRSGVLSR